MGLLGILLALGLLIWLAYRGWSVLLLAPAAALIAAVISREPLLAHWTQTFMNSAAQFIAQFFPLFLLGALFGKLMDDSGSVDAIARFMTERLGPRRAILAVVLAGHHVPDPVDPANRQLRQPRRARPVSGRAHRGRPLRNWSAPRHWAVARQLQRRRRRMAGCFGIRMKGMGCCIS